MMINIKKQQCNIMKTHDIINKHANNVIIL